MKIKSRKRYEVRVCWRGTIHAILSKYQVKRVKELNKKIDYYYKLQREILK